jgi:predicted aspartyl protease
VRFLFPALAAATLCAAAEPDWKKLLDQASWFELRDAAASHAAPQMVRAAIASVFHRDAEALALLPAAIANAPDNKEAERARTLLINQHFRAGRFAAALREIDEVLRRNPRRKDMAAARSLFSAMGVDQETVSRAPSRIPWSVRDGNWFFPATINGVEGEYLADTGANLSLLSESEAKRLGLSPSGGGSMGDSAGGSVALRAAVAPEVRIGEIVLRNVAFGVVGDSQQPFVSLPQGKRGVLGISILIALGNLTWDKDGWLEAGGSGAVCSAPNMAFSGAMPLVRVEHQGVPLVFDLDTGASMTSLWPVFARRFPEGLVKSGPVKLRGVGSSRDAKAARLPALNLRINGRDLPLRDVRVVLDEKTSLAGRIGLDAFESARRVGIDFQSMCLSVE